MRFIRCFAVCSVLTVLGLPLSTLAQEAPEQPDATAATEPATAKEKRKIPFAMYVSAAGGTANARDIRPSINNIEPQAATESVLSLQDQDYARLSIGWKLPNKKGDFRLLFNGYREDSYTFNSTGTLTQVTDTINNLQVQISTPQTYWQLSIDGGMLNSVRARPVWTDLNSDGDPCDTASHQMGCDNSVTQNEISNLPPDGGTTRSVTSDLQNRVQTWDALYGRSFGRRRYSSTWWIGWRYFKYEGNILAGAWLHTGSLLGEGVGWTDGAGMSLLSMREDNWATGPTGSMEADFNFFDQRLQLYVQGSAAFVVYDLSVDSGTFSTLHTLAGGAGLSPAPARLQETRSKSSWNTGAEAGIRYTMRNGLGFEAAYNVVGYLDAILLPSNSFQVQQGIPENCAQDTCLFTVYNTRDLIISALRVGINYQF